MWQGFWLRLLRLTLANSLWLRAWGERLKMTVFCCRPKTLNPKPLNPKPPQAYQSNVLYERVEQAAALLTGAWKLSN